MTLRYRRAATSDARYAEEFEAAIKAGKGKRMV